MQTIRGTGEHQFKRIVAKTPRNDRVDLRVKNHNRERRTNLCLRYTKRPDMVRGEILQGTMYYDILECTNCREYKSKKHFRNHAIQPHVRLNNGFNTRCRECQDRKYIHGYLVDNFVVTQQDDDSVDDSDWGVLNHPIQNQTMTRKHGIMKISKMTQKKRMKSSRLFHTESIMQNQMDLKCM